MNKKTTEDLEKILGMTHAKEMKTFLHENAESLIPYDKAFSEYIRGLIKKKELKKQDIFLAADIPERYGYKLLTEEKRTRQRDVILRICYAAQLTLDETQTALKLYRMPILYAKVPRDAMIMICLNERPGSIIDVNAFLKENGMEPLRSSGVQE